ncbi:MAG: nucleoside triphosphate pyrophosphohydrolase [Acidobacteriota bacterium]|nr:nucleoside triphosphate pyrophosphohydrolase [Acidobacteriota bacterium]
MTKPAAEGRLPQSGAGEAFQELVDLMARLRGPGGCPWDHEQTIESLRGFVLEETYEVLEAIDRRDHEGLKGEIGDLLFEGVFLAQIESDEGHFSVTDSLTHISAKLIRRHPHVFGDATNVTTPGAVVEQWEQIKAREQESKGEKKALLAGVPKAMPSLARANEISTRVAAVGFEWAHATDVLLKIEEEVAELRAAALHETPERAEEEMGDLLFSISNLARKMGIDAESALRRANDKFTKRFTALEEVFEKRGRSVHDATLDEMEAVWTEVKGNTK